MPRTFNEVIAQNPNDDEVNRSAIRALQAWQYLIPKAKNRQLVRYGELADLMGYADCRPLSSILGHIMHYCEQERLPALTIIVVNDDGTPGEGFTQVPRAQFDAHRETTFGFDWFSIYPPTPAEFTRSWDAAQRQTEN
jgi:putative restriction endonuclease